MKKFVTVGNLNELQPGDIIKGKFNDETYIVTANYGDRVTAVSTADVTSPPYWEVMREVSK